LHLLALPVLLDLQLVLPDLPDLSLLLVLSHLLVLLHLEFLALLLVR
jgi:hypothetical protein